MGILQFADRFLFGKRITAEQANKLRLSKYQEFVNNKERYQAQKYKKEVKKRNVVFKDLVKNKIRYMNGDTKIVWSKWAVDSNFTWYSKQFQILKKGWEDLLDNGFVHLCGDGEVWIGMEKEPKKLQLNQNNIWGTSHLITAHDRYVATCNDEEAAGRSAISKCGEANFWQMGKFGLISESGSNWWEQNDNNTRSFSYKQNYIVPIIYATHLLFEDQEIFDWVFKKKRDKTDFENNQQIWKEVYATNDVLREKEFDYEYWFKKNCYTPQIMKMQIKYKVPVPFSREDMISFGGEGFIEELEKQVEIDRNQELMDIARRENTWLAIEARLKERDDYEKAINDPHRHKMIADMAKHTEERRKQAEYFASDEFKKKMNDEVEKWGRIV